MSDKSDLEALEKLVGSSGWRLVRATMEDEILAAAMAIASSANMTHQEVDFRRGAIWAAQQLVNLPTRLQAKLELNIALNKDDRPPNPKR